MEEIQPIAVREEDKVVEEPNPLKLLNMGQYEGLPPMSYEEMAKRTSLHIQTIYKLAKADKEFLMRSEIGTFITIKKNLGVDLAKYINY